MNTAAKKPVAAKEGRCSSCGEVIVWRRTANDKPIPVDLTPTWVLPGDAPKGQRVTVLDADGRVVSGWPAKPGDRDAIEGRTLHGGQCPNEKEKKT